MKLNHLMSFTRLPTELSTGLACNSVQTFKRWPSEPNSAGQMASPAVLDHSQFEHRRPQADIGHCMSHSASTYMPWVGDHPSAKPQAKQEAHVGAPADKPIVEQDVHCQIERLAIGIEGPGALERSALGDMVQDARPTPIAREPTGVQHLVAGIGEVATLRALQRRKAPQVQRVLQGAIACDLHQVVHSEQRPLIRDPERHRLLPPSRSAKLGRSPPLVPCLEAARHLFPAWKKPAPTPAESRGTITANSRGMAVRGGRGQPMCQ